MGAAVRASGVKREEMFVTTKLWVQDHEYDDTLRAFDTSMAKLGLNYLDLNHSAAYDDQDPENTRWISSVKIH